MTDHMPATDSSERPLVCVVGSGWHFLSGISFHTCRMANALAGQYRVSAILMRRLLPRALYPGKARVGDSLTALEYRSDIPVFNGVDYFWGPSMFRALRELKRQRPDVVVLQWWTGAVLHSYLLIGYVAKRLGARVVIEFHEVQDTGEAAIPFAAAYVKRLIRPLLKMADAYAVHSEFDRDALTKQYGLGPKGIAVVPVGSYDHLLTTAEAPHEPAAEATASEPEPSEQPVTHLLYFGVIRPYKGVEHLVEAFNSLSAEEASRFVLHVVGETWEGWTRPTELIDASPHRDRIDFVNRYVHDEEVAEFFARADAVVLPYIRSSASGPLHMAMSYGLPVAVSSVGGLTEAAREYGGTRFVRPSDVADLRAALLELPGIAGKRYADPHSWEKSAEALATVF